MNGFHEHLILSIYGLAFFWMAAVLWQHASRLPEIKLGWLFRWLAAFGFVHGCKEFTQHAYMTLPSHGNQATDPYYLLVVLLQASSYAMLLRFGLEGMLLGQGRENSRWRHLPWALLTLWGGVQFVFSVFYPIPRLGEYFSRYFMATPGAWLTAWVLLRGHWFSMVAKQEIPRLQIAGLFFIFYGILALFGNHAPFFPANMVNQEQFLAWIGVPVQLLRTIAALAITMILGRSLGIFHQLEEERTLEMVKGKSRALYLSEERYRNLFHNSLEAIFLADAQLGILLDVNPAGCRLMATPREMLLGCSITRLHPPEEETRYWTLFNQVVTKGHGHFKGVHIQRADGLRLDVEIAASVFTSGQQLVVQEMFKDVSVRNRYEEALREKTDYLDSILRSSTNMAITACGLDFVVKYFNPAAEEMFGLAAHQVIGHTVQELYAQTDITSERFETAIHTVRQVGEFHYMAERPRGHHVRTLDVRICGIWDHHRQLIGFVLMARDVTDRLREEKELRQHRDHLDELVQARTRELEQANLCLQHQQQELRLYASMVASSHDHMAMVDRNYVYRAVNQAYLQNHGKTRQEIVGHAIPALLGEETFSHIKEKLDRCLTGEPIHYESWFTFAVTGRRWMDVSYTPFRDDAGQVQGVVVMARDATDRKTFEIHLQEMEQQFALFMEHLPGIAFIKNELGCYLYANPQLKKLSHCQDSHHHQQWCDDHCWPPETARALRGNDQLVFHSGQPHQFIETFTIDGEPTYWLLHRFPIRPDGALKLGGIGVNITEQIRAERISREMARFPDENPNPVLRVDHQGRVIYANRQGNLLLKQWRCQVGETLDNRWGTAVERALLLKRMERVEVVFGEKILALVIVPVAESNYVNLYGMEITELKQLLATLQEQRQMMHRLNADLEHRITEEVEKNRRKDFILMHQSRLAAMGEMIGAIAHQWRQPLNVLSLLLANLEDAHRHGDWSEGYLLQQVAKGNKILGRMSTTIDDFRNFFKPESTQEIFNPADSVKEALALVEAGMVSKGITLWMEEPAMAMKGFGYPSEFAQVVLLILGNARDAIQERQVSPGRVEIQLWQGGGQVITTIRDNGGGIPEPLLHKIFDPYFTTKEDKGGTGIGLYMAKMIIEEHMAGEIVAFNHGDGAEFQVRIPLHDS